MVDKESISNYDQLQYVPVVEPRANTETNTIAMVTTTNSFS